MPTTSDDAASPDLTSDSEAGRERGPVWDRERLVDPHRRADKADRVRAMFAAISTSYDRNNRIHSLGRDRAWRRRAVRLAGVRQGEDVVVDVACGTGDLAEAFADAAPARVIGVDFVPEMLDVAREKTSTRPTRAGRPTPEYRVGDATALDLADDSADIVSIAFGIRNVDDPAAAIREFRRILRPGGRLVILEFGRPTLPPLRQLYDLYFHHVMPRTATWLSGDRTGAYRYLPRSVSTFLTPERLTGLMSDAGFTDVAVKPLTFGICLAYVGRVAEREADAAFSDR